MAAWLVIIGAFMIGIESMESFNRIYAKQQGWVGQSQYRKYEAFMEYGTGIHFSSLIQVMLGLWAGYLGARIVIGDRRSVDWTRVWCKIQYVLIVLYVSASFSQSFIVSMQFDGNVNLDQPWIRAWSFALGFSSGTIMCGLGPYLVARYVDRSMKREDVQAWFEAAQNAGLDDAEIQGEP